MTEIILSVLIGAISFNLVFQTLAFARDILVFTRKTGKGFKHE